MSDTVYPVGIEVSPALEERNRLTTFFRFFLSIPHLLLVGGPLGAGFLSWQWHEHGEWTWSSSGGLLGAVAGIAAIIAWFAIVFTARHPDGLWRLKVYYLRWRVRAITYMALLRDDYPPFGDGEYPANLRIGDAPEERDRVTVFLRLLFVLPHAIVLCVLSLVWALTTALAWVAILVTGRYPESLYGFALGMLAWSIRVDAYVLLLRDEYPPFTLRVGEATG